MAAKTWRTDRSWLIFPWHTINIFCGFYCLHLRNTKWLMFPCVSSIIKYGVLFVKLRKFHCYFVCQSDFVLLQNFNRSHWANHRAGFPLMDQLFLKHVWQYYLLADKNWPTEGGANFLASNSRFLSSSFWQSCHGINLCCCHMPKLHQLHSDLAHLTISAAFLLICYFSRSQFAIIMCVGCSFIY